MLHHAGGWLVLIYDKCAVNEEGGGRLGSYKRDIHNQNGKGPPCHHDFSFVYFNPATFGCFLIVNQISFWN